MNRSVESISTHVDTADEHAADKTLALLNQKAKPPGSLGQLEDIACRLSAITGQSPPPRLAKAIIVMGADHGIAQEGVSAFPTEVTAQMLTNFAEGGAAINVLGRQAGATLVVVDMGTHVAPAAPQVLNRRVAAGTQNFLQGPAMTEAQVRQAIATGIAIAEPLINDGVNLIGLGEMGIGNTTSASALCAALLHLPAAEVTGRGTGIDDATMVRKISVIDEAIALHQVANLTPLQLLAALGGFELAGLVGVCLAAAANRVPVLLDGFITGAAALMATRICPNVQHHLMASHRSVEVGHILTLKELKLKPIFDLGLRLGEGSGAALAMPIIDASVALVHEMATFASAHVSERSA